MINIVKDLSNIISHLKKHNLYRRLRDVQPQHGSDYTKIIIDGEKYLNFSSNDYLGLSNNKIISDASIEYIKKYGNSVSASRLVTGNLNPYTKIEKKIALHKNFESAIIMQSGFQANSTIIPALVNKNNYPNSNVHVFIDKLCHASIIDGIQNSNSTFHRFVHNDMNHLEKLIISKTDINKDKIFIITESVFSMDGDMPDIKRLEQIKTKYNAFLIIDDAHGGGVIGTNGIGANIKCDLVVGTFGKAYASMGAYICTSKIVKKFLINTCRGLIYSTGLNPATLGAIDASIDIVKNMDAEREKLLEMAAYFNENVKKIGFETGHSVTQIVPVIVGDSGVAIKLQNFLFENKINATAIRTPTVPKNKARIRFAFSVKHTYDDINNLIKILKKFKNQNG